VRRLALVALVIATTAAAPHGAAAAACAQADIPFTGDADAARQGLLCLVNDERATRGLTPLIGNAALDEAAQAHVDDMVADGYFDHTAPDGSTPADRAARAGYAGDVIETLYQLQSTDDEATAPREPVTAWMQSPQHCGALLSPQIEDLGAGVSADGSTWDLELGATGANIALGGPCPANELTTPPPAVTLAGASTLAPRADSARVRLRCNRGAGCRGTATLTSHGRTLGHTAIALRAGRTATIRMPVRRTSATRATLRIAVSGTRIAIPVTLKLPGGAAALAGGGASPSHGY